MMLKNPRDAYYGHDPENVFLAVDERSGQTMGSCIVESKNCDTMFPQQPYHVKLTIQGENDVMDTLMGAALGRARVLCADKNVAARIYADCPPDDEKLLEMLKQYGFWDNDGVVRMSLDLPARGQYRAPAGCVLIRDALEDAAERKLFLGRWNSLFSTKNDQEWLAEFINHDNFQRLLTVAPTGMAGEIVTWTENGAGVIAFIQTARRWRGMGVAGYMLSLACDNLRMLGVRKVYADVRARTPHILHTMESFGFIQKELIRRYPGIDIAE